MNLKDTALQFKKKDITDLPEISLLDLEVKTELFEGRPWSYIELNGWKYSIKNELLGQIKETITYRPQTTKIKVVRTDKNELKVVPID